MIREVRLKGVDVQDYGSAAKDFHDASNKFQKLKNNDMALRAKANSKLYQLVNSKDRSIIKDGTCSIGYQLLGSYEQICQSRHVKIIRINISNIFKKTNF